MLWYDARRHHLWVTWVFELVGGDAWTRELREFQNARFAEQDDTLDALVERYRPSRITMDQTGMGEKPVEDAQRRYGTQRVEGVLMTPAVRLELAGSLKKRVEDVEIRIPKSTAVRQDLHAVRRAAGPMGAPRLVVTDDTDGHADRFWAAALACGAAETEPAVYELHRIDNHADLRGGRTSGGRGRCGGGGWAERCDNRRPSGPVALLVLLAAAARARLVPSDLVDRHRRRRTEVRIGERTAYET